MSKVSHYSEPAATKSPTKQKRRRKTASTASSEETGGIFKRGFFNPGVKVALEGGRVGRGTGSNLQEAIFNAYISITEGGSATELKTMIADPICAERSLEISEIVHRIADWAGGGERALSWCRAQPIAAFGGRTAEQLVKAGDAGAVRDYLDHLALGGFA